jgi:hypothetical protein
VCRDSGRGGAAGEGLATGVVAERDFWTSCGPPVDSRNFVLY